MVSPVVSASIFMNCVKLSQGNLDEILKPSGQVIKGVWRISRCQEAMKGVEDCDKPGEAVKRALIPGFLNYCMLNS